MFSLFFTFFLFSFFSRGGLLVTDAKKMEKGEEEEEEKSESPHLTPPPSLSPSSSSSQPLDIVEAEESKQSVDQRTASELELFDSNLLSAILEPWEEEILSLIEKH